VRPTATSAEPTWPLWSAPSRRHLSGGALERCIAPVEVEDFLAGYWERRPLAVPRDEPGRYDDLLSADELEQLVSSGGLRYPAFRLVRAGDSPPVREYTVDIPWRPTAFSASADVSRVLADFEAGATIVLQGLHLWRPAIGVFCRSLEQTLGHPGQANAYYTPRSAQGLPVHHDTHDVFCLQVSGEKRWLVYEPALELPLRDQRYTPELGAPGEPVLDLVLRPGDTLYLPRGWLHEALTSASDSLHLTVGINVYTALDAVKAALQACASDVEFRRSVPPDGALDDVLLERLRRRLEPAAVTARMRDKLVRTRRPILEGQLAQLRELDQLDVDTPLERRATVLFDRREGEGGAVELAFEGKAVRIPAQAREQAEFIAESEEPFTPVDLPGSLDDDGRLVLCRRLVREGFLRFSSPL
jgi:ribosomal protein L16 Arg81 hydroxylase